MSRNAPGFEEAIDVERVLFDAHYRRSVIEGLNSANPPSPAAMAGEPADALAKVGEDSDSAPKTPSEHKPD